MRRYSNAVTRHEDAYSNFGSELWDRMILQRLAMHACVNKPCILGTPPKLQRNSDQRSCVISVNVSIPDSDGEVLKTGTQRTTA